MPPSPFGETDLARLLRALRPVLHAEPYGFTLQPGPVPGAFATVAEEEGLTVVAPLALVPAEEGFARISLGVHSALSAVGPTAALSAALAAQGVGANVIAGLHHDHIFVPWDRATDAMEALAALSHDG
jgi:hypothetical protein